MDKKKTIELMNVLKETNSTKDLKDYLSSMDLHETGSMTFSEYITSLPEYQERKSSDVIRESNIERTYGYQILNGRKMPGRDKAIMICLALHLNLDMTQKALECAKLPVLYPRDRRDAIIIFAIEHDSSVDDTCDLLDEFGEKILE